MTPGEDRHYGLGLVVGKFAPLHLGHEALLRWAADQCAMLLVLSYSRPEIAGCSPQRRRDWLARRCPYAQSLVIDAQWLQEHGATQPMPANDAPDAQQQAWLAWLVADVLRAPVDALFGSEAYVQPTAAQLCARLGRPVAARVFDLQRRRYPISASRIRAAPHEARAFLSNEVAADFVKRIALVGAESTGKTTLAAALARHYRTAWAAEYGREWWEARAGQLQLEDLLHIGRTQVAREQQLLASAARYLFCDTTPLVTQGYSLALFGRCDPELQRLARRPYDLVLLCEPDFPMVQDGTRRDEGFRHRQHRWYEQALAAQGIPFERLAGPMAQRLQLVDALLRDLDAAAPIEAWPPGATSR